ncbi:hypothetical protein QBC34DRAFT_378297 [Podospora aff. communis PSN243]|uniref:Uncharacterized protein n=1 Tax=Podospora aff. communis PSN243 TaxID=3040156 RepID=A0AAV9GT27_9PEZI|nr:hypothetical protein QBC34DRAFT_378297 [Podospora aff. communis PSN243]
MLLSRLPTALAPLLPQNHAAVERARSLTRRTAQILNADTPGAKPIIFIIFIVFGIILFFVLAAFSFIWLRRYRRRKRGVDEFAAAAEPVFPPPILMGDIPPLDQKQDQQDGGTSSSSYVKVPLPEGGTVPVAAEKGGKPGDLEKGLPAVQENQKVV